MKTIILQSFRTFDVPSWIESCLRSVEEFSAFNGWDYSFLDDSFFELAPQWVRQRCAGNLYALTDICRLYWLKDQLSKGYERVLWVDADVLIFSKQHLSMPQDFPHAFSHELFIDGSEKFPKIIHGLSNALMMFTARDEVLQFYFNGSLEKLKSMDGGKLQRTIIGPQLLSELSQKRPLQLLYGVGLFSFVMMKEIAKGGGPIIQTYLANSPAPLGAANLCHFLRNAAPARERKRFDEVYEVAVEVLLSRGNEVLQ